MNRRSRRSTKKGPNRGNKTPESGNQSRTNALNAGLDNYRRGDLAAAEAAFRAVLSGYPDQSDALHLLAIVRHSQGDNGEAAALVARAVETNPQSAAFRVTQARVAEALGQLDAAEAGLRAALEISPKTPEALNNLGMVLRRQGRLAESASSYRQAIAARPNYPEALNNLGNVLVQMGDLVGAADALRRALAARPDFYQAHNNAGGIYKQLERFDDAERAFRRAIELNPGYGDAHCNLGTVLFGSGDIEGALACYQEALRLQPGLAAAHNNIGEALLLTDRWREAEDHLAQAIAANPDFAEAHYNLSRVLHRLGRKEDARQSVRRAMAVRADHAEGHKNRAFWLLGRGELEEGWKEYEGRTSIRDFGPFKDRVWKGEDLTGKSVIVWCEQGIGDQMAFASCFPDVLALAETCLIECDQRLVPLFQRSFPGAVVHGENVFGPVGASQWQDFSWMAAYPPIDYFIAAGSLPRIFRSRLDRFPSPWAPFRADPDRTAAYRRGLAAGGGPRIGICWRSLLRAANRNSDYPALDAWGPVFAVPGATYVNLQVAAENAEIEDIRERFGVDLRTVDDLDLKDDLDGTAALIAGLDGVVSAATNICVMAGGLGLPTWRIFQGPPEADTFCLGTDIFPWYPSVRRFSAESGDERSVAFDRIAVDVAAIDRVRD